MKCSDLFRTVAAVALSVTVAAVPAMAKNGNPKVAKPTAGPKAKAPRVQAAKAPNAQAPRATTQKRQVSSVTAPRSNTRATTSARRSSVNSKFFADPASGFKNSGQFNATVNNANNLGLDFWLLKDLMVNQGMSLGQAKKAAKAMDAGQAVRRGNAPVIQANTEPATTSPPTTSITPRRRPRNATVIQASTEPSTTSPSTTSVTPRRRPGNATVIQANTDKPPTTSRKVKDKR